MLQAGFLLAGCLFAGLLLAGCAQPGVRASPIAVGLGAIAGRSMIDLGDAARERGRFDPKTGEQVGTVRTSATFDAGVEGGPGRWTVRTQDFGPGGSPRPARSAGHVVGPYGGTYLSWSRSVKDTDPDGPARLYVFEPALIWFPAAIEPGVVFEDETVMTERDPDDEDRVVLRGKATRRVALIDATSESWPFEDAAVPGRAVAAELRVRVGPAEAVRRTITAMNPDGTTGPEYVDYSVRVLGVRITREAALITD